jgi:exosortase C (VPDSG-CTERM-specific)
MKLETNQSNPSSAPGAAESRSSAPPPANRGSAGPQFRGFFIFAAVLLLCFALPLFHLAIFAAHAELYTHILLIPFISVYLVWTKRAWLTVRESPASPGLALMPLAFGALLLIAYWAELRQGWKPEKPDSLAVITLAFLSFLLAGGFVFLGAKYLKSIAFPAAFLLFCVPFPVFVRDGIEHFLQRGSAEVAYGMLNVSGMPVLQTGNHFQLPGFSLDVAPECSGIHSTLILVITSLMAAYLFLKKPASRLVLMLVVVPLALLRNGFRIFVIAELCVRIGPHMIESPIHRRGGPVFFVLSLVPLFLLLVYLGKRELREEQAVTVPSK